MRPLEGTECDGPAIPAIFSFPASGPVSELPSREWVGSKAAGLMRMAKAGLPIPPGFVIGTEVCRQYLKQGRKTTECLADELDRAIVQLSGIAGRHWGDARRPLLVSVRSGAAVSMPGMMETVLNIGLNSATAKGLVRMTGNPRLAADCRRRLVTQYGEVVEGISASAFEERIQSFLVACHAGALDELDTASLNELADRCEDLYVEKCGQPMPSEPTDQLCRAIEAVWRSWSGPRATAYRRIHSLSDDMETAVVVQAMVFGNQGPGSGAGVGFTRSPSDGRPELYVDFLANAQGEDVVAGRRVASGIDELQRRAPDAYQGLLTVRRTLEKEFQDMQDFEFTIEDGRLFLLQTRSGKRTPLAALRIACDLVAEGLIQPHNALQLLQGIDLENLQQVSLRTHQQVPILRGTSAGTGVAVGSAVFDPARIPAVCESVGAVILIREHAETDDIEALNMASALVCRQGARTSHAAVVARQLGKPCVVGCQDLAIHADGRSARIGSQTIAEGTLMTVDGESGNIYLDAMQVVRQRPKELLDIVAGWTDSSANGMYSSR